MFCKSCGKIVDDDSKYCIHCGTKLFSDNVPIIENQEIIIETFDSSKIKTENNSTSKPTHLISDKHFLTTQNNQENVLEEFAPAIKKRMPIQKLIGVVIAFFGSLILASYISFLLFSDYSVMPEINLIEFWGLVWVSPTFGIQIFAIYGFVLMFISSTLLLKYNKVVFYKVISIAIDGLALFLLMYLAQDFFIGKSIDALKEYFYFSYYLQDNLLTNKIITWSLYFLLYYLMAELSGGTIGKRIAGLISHNKVKQGVSLKEGIKKTIIYATPIWIILISFLWNPPILNNLSNSIFFHFCQWMCFILFFISLFMIFISKENNSLADIFSKTVVEKKNGRIFMPNQTNKQTTLITDPEVLGIAIHNVSDLHKLIMTEKKKIFSGKNKLITDKLEELFKDKNSFFIMNSIYKGQYSKEIPEHLMSISSAYGLIYYYVEPLIKLGVCEEDFPHKIIDSSD